jgi:hypothetical protein
LKQIESRRDRIRYTLEERISKLEQDRGLQIILDNQKKLEQRLSEQNRIIQTILEKLNTPVPQSIQQPLNTLAIHPPSISDSTISNASLPTNDGGRFKFDAQVENGKGNFTNKSVTWYGPESDAPQFPSGCFRADYQTYVLVNEKLIECISNVFFKNNGKINSFRTRNHHRISLKHISERFKQHLSTYFGISIDNRFDYAWSIEKVMSIIRKKDPEAKTPIIPQSVLEHEEQQIQLENINPTIPSCSSTSTSDNRNADSVESDSEEENVTSTSSAAASESSSAENEQVRINGEPTARKRRKFYTPDGL